MPRRTRTATREIFPDAKYHNANVSRLINKVMKCGKKSVAESIVYDALQIMEQKEQEVPINILEQAIKNASPLLQVKPRRVGGATYQVPMEVQPKKSLSLAIRWLITSARARQGKSMAEKLAAELVDASKGQGVTIKKREDTHKMAEANRAFVHYKW